MSEKIKTIEYPAQLVAVAARQGLQMAFIEAWIVLKLLDDHGYILKMTEDFELLLRDTQGGDSAKDEPYTIRDCIELCQEMNEELLADQRGKKTPDEDVMESLQKDELILSGLMIRVANALPARVRVFNVAIIESLRKVIPIEAASWEEARLKAEEMWKNGECVLTTADFAGVAYTCYN